jgi:hypothetical protein
MGTETPSPEPAAGDDDDDDEGPVSALDPSRHVQEDAWAEPTAGEQPQSLLAMERENVRRRILELGRQIEKHRVASTLAGMAVAGAAATAGLASTALGVVSAFVAYRVLTEERARAKTESRRPFEEPLWLSGYCPECGQHVRVRAPAPGEQRAVRCSQGHLMHRVETLPLRPLA